ncbi:hypothetical protein FACS1894152_8270 [Bacilli bacterium]|nr:hypothetical protein FACS1894152_8270 [Bacilli bacterium]
MEELKELGEELKELGEELKELGEELKENAGRKGSNNSPQARAIYIINSSCLR